MWILQCIHIITYSYIIGSNMAPCRDDQFILYYHTDPYILKIMALSYFQSPNYFVSQGFIRATLLYLINKHLPGPNIHHYTKFFRRMVGHDSWEYYNSLTQNCMSINVLNHHITTTFPAA